jgi:hypothetical protein
MTDKKNEEYEPKEAQARFEASLRGALKTSPKPLKEKPKKRGLAKKKAARAT